MKKILARAEELGAVTAGRLDEEQTDLTGQWRKHGSVATFVLDDLLPGTLAHELFESTFGRLADAESSLRGRKRVLLTATGMTTCALFVLLLGSYTIFGLRGLRFLLMLHSLVAVALGRSLDLALEMCCHAYCSSSFLVW